MSHTKTARADTPVALATAEDLADVQRIMRDRDEQNSITIGDLNRLVVLAPRLAAEVRRLVDIEIQHRETIAAAMTREYNLRTRLESVQKERDEAREMLAGVAYGLNVANDADLPKAALELHTRQTEADMRLHIATCQRDAARQGLTAAQADLAQATAMIAAHRRDFDAIRAAIPGYNQRDKPPVLADAVRALAEERDEARAAARKEAADVTLFMQERDHALANANTLAGKIAALNDRAIAVDRVVARGCPPGGQAEWIADIRTAVANLRAEIDD